MFRKIIILILLILCSTVVLAQEPYHLKLLAVQQVNESYKGSTADLFLELKEGSGRVFLDTYPLTKMDTQVSTRFAKEIACKHYDLNCNKYDFIYTIKSESNIIGGPSAGAAIAALTSIAMLDLDYNSDVTITGTINSGAIIGPVGGVKEKLEAASSSGIKKVMISKGAGIQKELLNNQTNVTELNLIDYGKNNLSLEVIEAMDLDEVILQLTGVELNDKDFLVEENENYQEIMQSLQKLLCDRTEKIEEMISENGKQINESINEIFEKRKNNSLQAINDQDYYSAASFCFSNNILLRNNYYQELELDDQKINQMLDLLERKTENFKEQLNQEEITTISDLQTMIVVKERLSDVQEQIKKAKESEEKVALLSYAEERYFSAVSWKQFFSMEGKKFLLDSERLKQSCQQKISEAEERHQYASIFLGDLAVLNIKEKISLSRDSLKEQEYGLCLIKAAQAKAEANAILSSLGLSEDNFDEFIESKSRAVEKIVFENSAEGIFPILGYSYYQYANSLKDEEKYTTLIYLEYALEMSDLEIYFPAEKTIEISFNLDKKWIYLIIGIIIGIILTVVVKKKWFRKEVHLEFIDRK
jgi:uncharacterized protein